MGDGVHYWPTLVTRPLRLAMNSYIFNMLVGISTSLVVLITKLAIKLARDEFDRIAPMIITPLIRTSSASGRFLSRYGVAH